MLNNIFTMKTVLSALALLILVNVVKAEDRRFSLDAGVLAAIPRGAFSDNSWSGGNAGTGYGGTLRLSYWLTPNIGCGLHTGVSTFSPNDPMYLQLNYLFIPINPELTVTADLGVVRPYFSLGGGPSIGSVYMKEGDAKYGDTKILSDEFVILGIDIPVLSRISLTAEYGFYQVNCRNQTFHLSDPGPLNRFFWPPSSVTPVFDADFDQAVVSVRFRL
jgi:hypothetical protein